MKKSWWVRNAVWAVAAGAFFIIVLSFQSVVLKPLSRSTVPFASRTTSKSRFNSTGYSHSSNNNPNVEGNHADPPPNMEVSWRADQKLQLDENKPRYLQFFIQGGWSNQLRCLRNAYFLARATNRTLILSPVMPHGFTKYRDIFNDKTSVYRIQHNLTAAYLETLQPSRYIPLGRVLDVKFSLPLVATIDFREFYQTHNNTNTGRAAAADEADIVTSSAWVMELNYTHFNTHWILNRSDLEGHQEFVHHEWEHNRDPSYNKTFRDIGTVARAHANDTVWTFLDSFKVKVHPSLLHPSSVPGFRPRFTMAIRQLSQDIRDRWGNLPYAAVHIRGSDGPFKKPKAVADAIETGMGKIKATIQNWISDYQQQRQAGTSTLLLPPPPPPPPTDIGLYVATDIHDLAQHKMFVKKVSELAQTMKDGFNVTVQVVFLKDFQHELVAFEQTQNADNTMGYPIIFLDQQMAACATIGFSGTAGSTFSNFISTLRAVGAC